MGAVTTGTIIGAAVIGTAGTIVASEISANSQEKMAKRAKSDKERLMYELEELENDRQDVINPYDDVVSLDEMIVDNTGLLSNPFENIGVATKAAEFQAEEADIALANTLDLLASTGSSAGGATALAQAALQSKRNISADLQKQESNNEKLAAQGEQFLQQQKLSEARRVQQAQLTEAQRMQQSEVLGKEFVYGETERRQTEELNRKQAQITGQAQAEMASRQNAANIRSAGVTSIANIASSGLTSLAMMK